MSLPGPAMTCDRSQDRRVATTTASCPRSCSRASSPSSPSFGVEAKRRIPPVTTRQRGSMQTLTFGDPEIVLRGQIYTDYFYGRSGYGETPEIDELEHSIFLALDTPISIPARAPRYEGDFESVGCADVESVQLAGKVDIQHLRDIRGHGVEITGSLFHSYTGHHHAEILVNLQDRLTSILDDRNTYTGAHVARSGT